MDVWMHSTHNLAKRLLKWSTLCIAKMYISVSAAVMRALQNSDVSRKTLLLYIIVLLTADEAFDLVFDHGLNPYAWRAMAYEQWALSHAAHHHPFIHTSYAQMKRDLKWFQCNMEKEIKKSKQINTFGVFCLVSFTEKRREKHKLSNRFELETKTNWTCDSRECQMKKKK